jgi:multidrug efflux system membrane fusion protein
MKRSQVKWLLLGLALLLAAGAVLLVVFNRSQQQLAASAAQRKATQEAVVELAPTDVTPARQRDLAQGLPVSGSLRAINSAVVKARVAGELQGLTVREGDTVKAGQVIARIDATESQARLRQAQQQADSARSQIDIAQRQYDSNKALVDQGFISKSALATAAL